MNEAAKNRNVDKHKNSFSSQTRFILVKCGHYYYCTYDVLKKLAETMAEMVQAKTEKIIFSF